MEQSLRSEFNVVNKLQKKETQHTDPKCSLKTYGHFIQSFNTPSLNHPFTFDINTCKYINEIFWGMHSVMPKNVWDTAQKLPSNIPFMLLIWDVSIISKPHTVIFHT